MTLDIKKNSSTALVPCAPCCHKTKEIYDGIAAVITPSYQDGITYPFAALGYNSRGVTYSNNLFTYYVTWGYDSSPLALVLIQTDGNIKTYQNECNLKIPLDNANVLISPFFGFDDLYDYTNARFFLKLIVVENISLDVFFSVDGTTWTKQQETFYGEYLSFEITSALQTNWFSDPIELSSPIKMRITINTGNFYKYPSDAHYKFSESGKSCYDGDYRRNIQIVEIEPGIYGPENGENVVCPNEKFKKWFYQDEFYGKFGVKSGIAFSFFDIIAGRADYNSTLGNWNTDTGPIIYPAFDWVGNDGSNFVNNLNNYQGFIDEGNGVLLRADTALIDYRKPVHFVSKPFYLEATVNVWGDYRYTFNNSLNPGLSIYEALKLLWSAKMVITE